MMFKQSDGKLLFEGGRANKNAREEKPQNSRRPILNRGPGLIMNGDQVNCMKMRSRRFGPVMLITVEAAQGRELLNLCREIVDTCRPFRAQT